MDWSPYRACCARHAGETEAGFCPECGHPFLRCLAFAECRSLVTPTQPCPVCMAPALMIDAGAVVRSKTGERLSVPLILRNATSGLRPIWVKQILKWNGQVDEPVALTWEQIEAGAERHFALDTPPLEEGGTHSLRVILVIASRYKGIEEAYAFAAGMSIAVSGQDSQQIIQNINLSGAQFQTGGMVHTQLNTKGTETTAPAGLADRTVLALERAEKYELERGVRGYADERLRVPRHVEFAFPAFPQGDAPPAGATLLPTGRMACGRNSRTPDPASQAVPSDVCLRAYDPRTSQIDEPATLAISRHHFDFVVVNDRLCLQARATGGLEVAGTHVGPGEVVILKKGDRIVPIPGRPEKLALYVSFSTSIGTVDRVDITRSPGPR